MSWLMHSKYGVSDKTRKLHNFVKDIVCIYSITRLPLTSVCTTLSSILIIVILIHHRSKRSRAEGVWYQRLEWSHLLGSVSQLGCQVARLSMTAGTSHHTWAPPPHQTSLSLNSQNFSACFHGINFNGKYIYNFSWIHLKIVKTERN